MNLKEKIEEITARFFAMPEKIISQEFVLLLEITSTIMSCSLMKNQNDYQDRMAKADLILEKIDQISLSARGY
jgi:hypothetical protein